MAARIHQQRCASRGLEWSEAAKAMPDDDWEDYSDNEEDDTTLIYDDGEDE